MHIKLVNKKQSIPLKEDVSDFHFGLSKYKGGTITFSTDVNAVLTDKNKIVKYLKGVYHTFMNRHHREKILNDLINKWNEENNYQEEDEMYLGAFTVKNNVRGSYASKSGKVFDENSASLYIGGVPSELLLLFATKLCKRFKQETVLVEDYNNGKSYLVNGEDSFGTGKEERVKNASKQLADNMPKVNTEVK